MQICVRLRVWGKLRPEKLNSKLRFCFRGLSEAREGDPESPAFQVWAFVSGAVTLAIGAGLS